MGKERIDYIDVMKGIGILLVCLGHCMTRTTFPLNRFLLSFHMPLFFFISGFLISLKEKESFGVFFKKNLYALAVPQITLALLLYICSVLLNCVLLNKCSISELNPLGGLWAWFLPTLFMMNMIVWSCLQVTKCRKWFIPVLTLVVVCIFCFLKDGGGLEHQILCASVFGLVGCCAKNIVDWVVKNSQWRGIGFMGYFLCAVLSFYNEPIKMFMNQYGFRPLFVFVALLGIFSTLDIAVALRQASLFSFFGKNSIIIYVTHISFMDLFHRGYRLFISGSLESHGKYPHFLILFLMIMVGEFLIIPWVNRYVPFLFGKRFQK